MLAGYARFRDHGSLFPTGSGEVEKFAKERKAHSINKSTIRFPADQLLPGTLLKRIVKARVAENRERDQADSSASLLPIGILLTRFSLRSVEDSVFTSTSATH